MAFDTILFHDFTLFDMGGLNAVRKVLWTNSSLGDGTTRNNSEVLIDGEESPVPVLSIMPARVAGLFHMRLADGRELIDLHDTSATKRFLAQVFD